MRKSRLWLIVISAVSLLLGIGVTVAYLVTSSNTVHNTFTVGSVSIILSETTGEKYTLTPGAAIKKDPNVTVVAGSEECWLFVKVEKSSGFNTYCTYEMADGWHILAGHTDVYYRTVKSHSESTNFKILKDDSILVRDSLTEELLNSVTENPTLKFTAYAAQTSGLDTVHDAWELFNQ